MNEEWIKRVVEEFKETIIFETEYEEGMRCHYQDAVNWLRAILEKNQERLHHQLQKAREEEKEKVHRMVDNILAVSIDYHMDSVVLARDIENIAKKYFPTKDHSELDQAELEGGLEK